MIPINPFNLVPIDVFRDFPIEIDVVYANKDHPNNGFGQIYALNASLWCNKDLCKIVLHAAVALNKRYGWKLRVLDCLRTVEAQTRMSGRGIDEALVSAPGQGAHPRAMAIDIEPIDADGVRVEMGTPFDFFADDLSDNKAARNYTQFGSYSNTDLIRLNRAKLETAFSWAGTKAENRAFHIVPLKQEWWDFRFCSDLFERYAPLSEGDLPEYMKLLSPAAERNLTNHQDAINEVRSADYSL